MYMFSVFACNISVHNVWGFMIGSSFGGVLDMVTDRVSTCGFLVILSNLLPEYSFVFIMLLVLDVASHWFHVIRFDEQFHFI